MHKRELGILEGLETGKFGDVRRGRRFRNMLRTLSRKPAGKVSDVFTRPADRQGAYDFLESDKLSAEQVQIAAVEATARRCAKHKRVLVLMDGSSLSLTDSKGTKDFGSIGSRKQCGRGLKMLNALALSWSGETLGVLSQVYWARGERRKKGYRPLAQRESRFWHEAHDQSRGVLAKVAPETELHVVTDREGDATALLLALSRSGSGFTIRASQGRKALVGEHRVFVRSMLKKTRPIAKTELHLPAKGNVPARIAKLSVRAAEVDLVLRDLTRHRRTLRLTAVWAVEENRPRNAASLDWMLYTTEPARTAKDALAALQRYAFRWRIEEFHRTLKDGGGRVEDSQLRSKAAVIKWATMHAMVATRAQRLRDIARTTPELSASSELSDLEIEALVLLKTQEKRRTETVSADNLDIGTAVRWIADLGGFTATGASKRAPGPTVIHRGLERVMDAVEILGALRAAGKLR